MNAMAAPGEVVGTVAAQSIGEPTTQVGPWAGTAQQGVRGRVRAKCRLRGCAVPC